jgi:F-type H+-transporting ATPase subunit delta
MKEKNVAKVWAQSLLELAREKKALDAVEKGVRLLGRLFVDEPLLRPFLASPNIPAQEKTARFRKAVGKKVPALILDFVSLLVERNRGMVLPDILETFIELYREETGLAVAHIRCAVALQKAQETALEKSISKIVGMNIELDVVVDPAVLGGITIQVGDTRFDGSLKRALDEVGARMSGTRLDSEVVYANKD